MKAIKEIVPVKSLPGSSSPSVSSPGKSKNDRQAQMEKKEQICNQLGVPSPYHIYLARREFNSGNPNRTQFSLEMPTGLDQWVNVAEFEFTITQINNYLLKAERINCCTVCGGACKFFTFYGIRLCIKPSMKKTFRKINTFIDQQNRDIYHPKGLHIVNPAVAGFRHIEFKSTANDVIKYCMSMDNDFQILEEVQSGKELK